MEKSDIMYLGAPIRILQHLNQNIKMVDCYMRFQATFGECVFSKLKLWSFIKGLMCGAGSHLVVKLQIAPS